MALEKLGWDNFFQQNFDTLGKSRALSPARVTGVRKNSFLVSDGNKEFQARASGRLFHESTAGALFPAAGDWVTLRDSVITGVLPRKNALSREASGNRDKLANHAVKEQVIAANLDTVFIVCGLDRDFSTRRIERYLTLVYNSGASPVVVLNKADLHQQAESFSDEVESVAMGVPVNLVSAKNSVGLEMLNGYLSPGKTAVLLGSSGVGKSTLVNRLAGKDLRATSQVSERDGKGVHTTVSRDLICLPGGGMIIDNPGLREITFWDNEGGLETVFGEIIELAQECRFSDCGHQGEPGCRVQEAISSGELSASRFENYLKMKREINYLSQRQQKTAARIEKERWKDIAIKAKNIKKGRKFSDFDY